MKKEDIVLLLEDIEKIHTELAEESNMLIGTRDIKLLESAVYAPFQTFLGEELYPTIYDKAAQLCFGLVKNHPFVDGNKRTALQIMLVYLMINGIDLVYDDDELESFIISVAEGKTVPEEIALWIKAHELK